jgi:hypothetical protein
VWAIRRGRYYDALIAGPRWSLVRLKPTWDTRSKILVFCGEQEAVALLHKWGFLTESDSPNWQEVSRASDSYARLREIARLFAGGDIAQVTIVQNIRQPKRRSRT